MERRIRKALHEAIDEFIDNVTLDTVKSGNHGLPIVYQLAFEDRLPSIFKNGMSREFAASAGGNFYCTGLYTTFNLRSTIENSKTKSDIYGGAIVKMGIKSYDRFFICDKKIAMQEYGDKWRYEDQLEILFGDTPSGRRKLQEIKNGPYWGTITQTSDYMTSKNVMALHEALGGMHCQADGALNKYHIMGFVFHGHNDGDVAIIRDFKGIIPLAYSLDHGRTWRDDLLSDSTIERTAKDFDPIIALGRDLAKYENPKTYRLINGWMRVQRKEDMKYNFLEPKTQTFLSDVWFDQASPFDDNGKAFVTLDGQRCYVDQNGFYEEESDEYPFMSFDEYIDFKNNG